MLAFRGWSNFHLLQLRSSLLKMCPHLYMFNLTRVYTNHRSVCAVLVSWWCSAFRARRICTSGQDDQRGQEERSSPPALSPSVRTVSPCPCAQEPCLLSRQKGGCAELLHLNIRDIGQKLEGNRNTTKLRKCFIQ